MTEIDTKHELTNYIYVLLSDTGTCFTRLIKGFTGAPYNHASLVIDDDLEEVYSFGRKQARNPFIAGFVKEDIYEGTFRHYQNTRCVLLQIEVTAQQRNEVIQLVQEFEKGKNKYRYNLIGLVGVLCNINMGLAHSYFCSQFVAEALRRSGIRHWDRPSTLVTPHDFLMNEPFRVVYEGYLYDYPKLDRHRLVEHKKRHFSALLLRKRLV
ncbi:hypothetical protein [Paenibacillus luteus]|uniref:hypothetical protein n=1 Tax=Paenibacillus luteus TaxID=2545753 RepID=UPI0011436AE5|nr:hypothetical protein [Paenibacillus luteus]